jgi:cyclopentanol dehydrogenase
VRIENKVAIITGATSGIGRASAILFAREGAKIVAVGRRVTEGKKTVDTIHKLGGEGYLRVSFAVDTGTLQDGLIRIKKGLDAIRSMNGEDRLQCN